MYNFLFKRGEIGENPLVIVNDSFTSYSSIDLLKYRNINFKEIDKLYEDDKLKKLSEIVLNNIKINFID